MRLCMPHTASPLPASYLRLVASLIFAALSHKLFENQQGTPAALSSHYVNARVEWSPMLELYELTAEVKDEQGRTLMKGLSAKVCTFCLNGQKRLTLEHFVDLPEFAVLHNQSIVKQLITFIANFSICHRTAYMVSYCSSISRSSSSLYGSVY